MLLSARAFLVKSGLMNYHCICVNYFRRNKMQYFLIIIGAAALFFGYMAFEASYLEKVHVDVSDRRLGLKVALLADFHVGRIRVSAKRVKRAIDAENIDILLLAGDFIENASQISLAVEYLKNITGSYKVFLCFGNHDHRALSGSPELFASFISEIENLGIKCLINESHNFEHNGKAYNITGIDDIREGNPDIAKALASRQEPSELDIVLTHNPDTVLMLPEGEVDYLMAGHFHGGQVWTPFKLEFITLRKDLLCKTGITRGLHVVKGINVYLNRGLGNVVFPLRFLSRPEITFFTF